MPTGVHCVIHLTCGCKTIASKYRLYLCHILILLFVEEEYVGKDGVPAQGLLAGSVFMFSSSLLEACKEES